MWWVHASNWYLMPRSKIPVIEAEQVTLIHHQHKKLNNYDVVYLETNTICIMESRVYLYHFRHTASRYLVCWCSLFVLILWYSKHHSVYNSAVKVKWAEMLSLFVMNPSALWSQYWLCSRTDILRIFSDTLLGYPMSNSVTRFIIDSAFKWVAWVSAAAVYNYTESQTPDKTFEDKYLAVYRTNPVFLYTTSYLSFHSQSLLVS